MQPWLFLGAAFVLVAFGGLMAAVDSAIAASSRADITDLALGSRARRSLLAIADDTGAHVNAVNFMRIIAETTAAVLVTLAFTSFLDNVWLVLLLLGAHHDGRVVRARRGEPAQRRAGERARPCSASRRPSCTSCACCSARSRTRSSPSATA